MTVLILFKIILSVTIMMSDHWSVMIIMLSDHCCLCPGVPDQASLRSPWARSTYPPTRHQPGLFRCHWCLWWLFMLSMMITKMMKMMWSSNCYSTGGLRAHEPQLHQVRLNCSLFYICQSSLLSQLMLLLSSSSSRHHLRRHRHHRGDHEVSSALRLIFSFSPLAVSCLQPAKIFGAKNRVSIENIPELHLHFIK